MTTKRFRIGVNTLFFIPGEVGGSETYLRQTLSAIAENFPDVELVLFTNAENAPILEKDLSLFPQVRFCHLRFRASNRYMRIVREQTELPIAVRRCGVDVLWSPGYTAPVLFPCPQVTSILDMQYIRHPEDLSPLARVTTDFLVQAAAIRSSRIITISEFSKSEIIRFTRAKEIKISVTHLGVSPRFEKGSNTDLSRSLPSVLRRHKGPYILSVANSYPHKNLHTLVDAFGKITDRVKHRLVMVGRSRLGEGRVQKASARIPDRSRIIRLSGLNPVQLIALYQGADLFVYPSLYEGFGLPVLEAMIAGTPVVTTRMGSIPEVGGPWAAYADPPDADTLSEKMIETLQLSPERKSGRILGAIRHASAFRWENTARKTLQVLRQACRFAFR